MGRGRGSNQQLQQGGRSKKLKAPRIFPRGFWTLTFVVLRLVLMICKRTDYKLILGNGRRSKPFFVQQKRFISTDFDLFEVFLCVDTDRSRSPL